MFQTKNWFKVREIVSISIGSFSKRFWIKHENIYNKILSEIQITHDKYKYDSELNQIKVGKNHGQLKFNKIYNA